MMFEQLTVEEVNMISIFKDSEIYHFESKGEIIEELNRIRPFLKEPDLEDLADNVLKKLSAMSDADFAALELYPEFEDYDDEEV
jgi:hypothetical protein